jgi:hypothetical protein
MKRIYRSLILSLIVTPLFAAQTPSAQPAAHAAVTQPVYIYLYSRVTDQVNLDISEARLRRLLPMIERYRTQHPEAHLKATIFFSGASSEALAERNAQTGIKDYVLDFKNRGIIEIGYDGTDEPTYEHRPMSHMLESKAYRERWLERAAEDEKFLTEGRDPLTGDPRPGSVGGLQAMQQVFGKAACITGVSVGTERVHPDPNRDMPGAGPTPTVTPEVGDWEIAPLLRRYNTEAILFGLPGTNPAHIPGFGGSILEIGHMMSPTPETSPELFWADNILRSSESAGLGARVIRGNEGSAAIKEFTTKLDRSRIRIIHMELGSDTDYLKPDFAKTTLSATLTYAYAHPDNPKVPAEDRLTPDQVNVAFSKEEATLNWLVADFLPANSGSRFVSNTDLQKMTSASAGYSVSVDELRAALKQTLDQWGSNTFPPPYFQVGNRYLSMAEAFQVMTDALAGLSRTGKLPESVPAVQVYGPLRVAGGHGPNVGDVPVASVAKVCAQIADDLHDTTGYPIPNNTVPSVLVVDGIGMNAAQFLRLMAQALVEPDPNAKVRVRMTYMYSGTAEVFPKTRAMEDTGATWTFKPAPLAAPSSTLASR